MQQPQDRIDLAHEISDALKRFRGRGIDVEAMLTREDYAHDILQQCKVSGDATLRTLAADFSIARRGAAAPARRIVRSASSVEPARTEMLPGQRTRSWLAPLDIFSRRSGAPRG